jgi:glycosyltransferase involved in cell wall biosynthesis
MEECNKGHIATMTNKRVLHIVQSLNFGGVESRMRTIALNSSLSNYIHSFCAISNGGAVADELVASGKPVTVKNIQSNIPSFSAITALIKHIRTERPHIIHCHGAEANFHGLISGRLCGIPVCLAEEIGIPNHSPKARFTFRLIYRLATRVVAVSEPVKRAILKDGEAKEDQCEVLLNPFQMLEQRKAYNRGTSFHIGYVGRLEVVKNPLGLIRAIALLRNKGLSIKLTIAGDGTERNVLEREVKNLHLQENVFFLGFSCRPFEAMEDISLYALPSFSEGLSNSLIEAMSAGIPVLATAVGGTPDVIKHGENGWLLSGPSPEAIADGIEKCIALEDEKLNAVGRNGRLSVVERFSPKSFFIRCDDFYDGLLAMAKR